MMMFDFGDGDTGYGDGGGTGHPGISNSGRGIGDGVDNYVGIEYYGRGNGTGLGEGIQRAINADAYGHGFGEGDETVAMFNPAGHDMKAAIAYAVLLNN